MSGKEPSSGFLPEVQGKGRVDHPPNRDQEGEGHHYLQDWKHSYWIHSRKLDTRSTIKKVTKKLTTKERPEKKGRVFC